MRARAVLGLFAGLLLSGHAAAQLAQFKIVTASERGTYIQIGHDLAKFIAPAAGIELQVLPSAGSSENVQRLRYEEGVKFAMVQSDVYQAYLDLADSGQKDAAAMIRPLRVIMPLYNEEIYFVTRADSALQFAHEIRDAKLNVGPLKSGTALSAATLYRQMFGAPLPDANASYLPNEEALVKLVTDKSLDVVVIVAGQPAKLLVDMKPEARQLIKLLRFDPKHATSATVLKTYFPATVRAASYPNLLAQDVPGIAVKAFLVTYDYRNEHTVVPLSRFARAMCRNLKTLQEQGHPKWREVSLGLPDLGRGWRYSNATQSEFRACMGGAAPRAMPAASIPCTQQTRILGLCG